MNYTKYAYAYCDGILLRRQRLNGKHNTAKTCSDSLKTLLNELKPLAERNPTAQYYVDIKNERNFG